MKKIKVGDTVQIIKNDTASVNPVGSIGVVSLDKYNNGEVFRVIVKGISDDNTGNGSVRSDLKLVSNTQQKIEKLLKKISKLNKL